MAAAAPRWRGRQRLGDVDHAPAAERDEQLAADRLAQVAGDLVDASGRHVVDGRGAGDDGRGRGGGAGRGEQGVAVAEQVRGIGQRAAPEAHDALAVAPGEVAGHRRQHGKRQPRARAFLTLRKGSAGTLGRRVSLLAPTAAPHDAPPRAPLGDLHARMVEAASAEGGLAAVARLAAEATGGSVAIVAPAQGAATIAPRAGDARLSAVRRYVTDRLADRPAQVPAGVVAEAPIRAGAQSLGAVVALADGGEQAAAAAEIVRLAALVALAALALERDEPASDDGGALVRALREGRGADAAVLLADAGASALAHGAIGLCAHLPDRAGWLGPIIAEQFPGAPCLQEDGIVWALLPALPADDAARATTAAAHRVAARLGAHTAVGLSPFAARPERLRDALRQARVVLELARSGQVDVEEATTGTWRLLLGMAVSDPDELATCVAGSIGPALDHDARLRTELVATFRAYLAHGANMNATASAIYAHRHTVAARLERLGALTRLDPMRHEDRERLGVGLKASAVLEASPAAISH